MSGSPGAAVLSTKRDGFPPYMLIKKTNMTEATIDPISIIRSCREAARNAGDANADLSFLALADVDARVSVRTLVLRDMVRNGFSLFINETSPKWQLLAANCHYELLLWYPSQQRQFRIQGTSRALDKPAVHKAWQNKPLGAKLMDHVYESLGPQSTPITNRQLLSDKIDQLKDALDTNRLKAPQSVSGIELLANRIEVLELNSGDSIHHRQTFQLNGDVWFCQTMIP